MLIYSWLMSEPILKLRCFLGRKDWRPKMRHFDEDLILIDPGKKDAFLIPIESN